MKYLFEKLESTIVRDFRQITFLIFSEFKEIRGDTHMMATLREVEWGGGGSGKNEMLWEVGGGEGSGCFRRPNLPFESDVRQ